MVVLHLLRIERLDLKHIQWLITILTSICALRKQEKTKHLYRLSFFLLVFNVLVIVIPFKYSSIANVGCLLVAIPATSSK